ncbi:chalcone isomerase family protein [Ramlibacter rhizophilus]|uniref:chalcone isomerase family protein n=1 Tax=Ramlibacter rhizophilus TaxID=1781167 RepID=UPI001F118379|nr:chalcone isomerase family protein [Ramlibacter rhizophilus]
MNTAALGLSLALAVQAGASASEAAARPPELAQASGELLRAGGGRLTWWGFAVYDAALWTAPAFRAARFEQHEFMLTLTYLRELRARDIAKVSLEEMRRHDTSLAPETAARWQEQLARLLPDIRPGERLSGLHRPGRGVLFLHNGQAIGELADPVFARLFFSIWLAAATSEPTLREQLLRGTTP